MGYEDAITIIKDGGTLRHDWEPGEPVGDLPTMKHVDSCKWCEAVRTLEGLVQRTRIESEQRRHQESW
jgi:hypothetical protein